MAFQVAPRVVRIAQVLTRTSDLSAAIAHGGRFCKETEREVTPIGVIGVREGQLIIGRVGGVPPVSMMIQPIWASGCTGGTCRFTGRNSPPLGSLSLKLRSL